MDGILGLQIVPWLLVLLLSLVLPLSILYGRGNVRRRRLALLNDLEQTFNAARPDLRASIQPMMQFVRSRYTNSHGGDNGDTNHGWLLSFEEIKTYLLPTTILVLLSGVGFYELFAALRLDGFKPPIMLLVGPMSVENSESYQAGTALVIAAAFLGAYIWSIRYLILRIANFDLSPLSFLRVSAHILLIIMVAWVFRHVVAAAAPNPGDTLAALTLGGVLGIVFLMGLYPGLGIETLIDRLPGNLRIKRVVPEAAQISREFPLDLLDGVDASIKFRLGTLEINDVQNLAAVNPVFLYIESPYGLYQILDWIAQSQLLIAVGPKRFLELRAVNVRDIHGILTMGESAAGREVLKPILLPGVNAGDEVVEAAIESIAGCLHVQRLQKIRSVFLSSLEGPGQRSAGGPREVTPEAA